MESAEKTYRAGADVAARFYRLIDALEEHLDRGFFLSFIGKIVVDEKKIYSLLNELRALTPEAVRHGALRGSEAQLSAPLSPAAENVGAPRPTARDGRVAHVGALQPVEEEAARIRFGADKYAHDVLGELEGRLQSISEVIQHGRDVLKKRMQDQEVK